MPTKPKAKIKSSLKIVGQWFYGEGKTITEAITSIKPAVKKGIAVLTLEKGTVKKERVLPPHLTLGLFSEISPTQKEVAFKQVNELFDKSIFE
jgi:hypothetical protein